MSDTLNDRIDAHLAKARAAKEDAPVTVWWANGSLIICSGAGNVFDTYTPQRAAHIAANDPATIEAFCAVAKVAEGLDDICNLMEDWYCHSHSCDACGSITDPCILAPLRAARRALYDALGKE